MIQAFEFLFNNLGLSIQGVYLLLVILVSLIFSASDYRIGLIIFQLLSFTGMIVFNLAGYDSSILLYMGLTSIVLMVFTTFAEKTSSSGRGLV